MSDQLKGIYSRHGDMLYASAYGITRNAETAEDAVHHAFTNLLSKPERLKGKTLLPYVITCVRNAAIDQIRRAPKDRGNNADMNQQISDAPEPQARLFTTDAHEQLCERLNRLPEEQREVVLLKIHGEMTFAEIGEALAIPLQTAATRYRRALDTLKTMIGENNE